MKNVLSLLVSLGQMGSTLWQNLDLDAATVINIMLTAVGVLASGSWALWKLNILGMWRDYLDASMNIHSVRTPLPSVRILDVELRVRNRGPRPLQIKGEESHLAIYRAETPEGEGHAVSWKLCAMWDFHRHGAPETAAIAPKDLSRLNFQGKVEAGHVYRVQVRVASTKGGAAQAEKTFFVEGDAVAAAEPAIPPPEPESFPEPGGSMAD